MPAGAQRVLVIDQGIVERIGRGQPGQAIQAVIGIAGRVAVRIADRAAVTDIVVTVGGGQQVAVGDALQPIERIIAIVSGRA